MAWNDLLKSIFKAAKILNIDITEKDIPDYDNYYSLEKLNTELWSKVYANKKVKKTKLGMS